MRSGIWYSLALMLGCSSSPVGDDAELQRDSSEPVAEPRTVVLITLDSTRADALSCYGDAAHWNRYIERELRDHGATGTQLQSYLDRLPEPHTPHLCGLVETGLRFQWALSHAPSSLSSHVSILAGMEPHRHRVVREGYSVPDDVLLLPAALQGAGWDTLAVVGSSELTSTSGLDRGFRGYIEPSVSSSGLAAVNSALEVNRSVKEQLDARAQSTEDLFLFVHYADASKAWNDLDGVDASAAEELRVQVQGEGYRYSGSVDGSLQSMDEIRRLRQAGALSFSDSVQARGLYLSQVSRMDHQVGLLLKDLEDRGRLQNALIVVVGDHGLALDDSPTHPYGHSAEVDLHSIHVPLLVAGTGTMSLEQTGGVHPSPVRLMDLASTLAVATGVAEIHGDGQDLGAAWTAGASPRVLPHFAEATGPVEAEDKAKWNNLSLAQAVVQEGLLLQKRPVRVGEQRGYAVHLYALAAGQPMVSMTEPDGRPSQLAYETTERLMGTLKLWNDSAPAHRSLE